MSRSIGHTNHFEYHPLVITLTVTFYSTAKEFYSQFLKPDRKV